MSQCGRQHVVFSLNSLNKDADAKISLDTNTMCQQEEMFS